MTVVGVLLGFAALVLLLPVTVLLAQVLSAYFTKDRARSPAGARPGLAVLIPAHDEAAVIVDTLAALRSQLSATDRLLVVADNCTDETANLARAAGAEVVERRDADRRGKGYALDYGVQRLQDRPPEVLIVVDADCHVATGSLDRLAECCIETGHPAQALYLMHAPPGAGLRTRIAEFAWLVKNQVRPLGSRHMGLPCQLMGTGMAFPWSLVGQMRLANADLVEDMKLGIDLALAENPVMFCPEAQVTSRFPATEGAVRSQRTRWEHGHLSLIIQEVPRLVKGAVVKGDLRLLALGLDLAVPPLALLAMMLAAVLTLSGIGILFGLPAQPLRLTLLACLIFAVAVLLAWHRWGRQAVSLTDLLSVPFYALAKIPLYLRFWTRRQKEWVRTDRE